jgi:hypothetical protein
VESAKSVRLPGPKDRPGWQLFIFGKPTLSPPSEPSPEVDDDVVEGQDEVELLNTQPVSNLDVDDASSSDVECGPSRRQTPKLMEKDAELVSHNEADGRTESSAAANTHNDLLPEPSLALLRGFNQVCLYV